MKKGKSETKYHVRLYSRYNEPVLVSKDKAHAIEFATSQFPNTNHYVVEVTETLVHLRNPMETFMLE